MILLPKNNVSLQLPKTLLVNEFHFLNFIQLLENIPKNHQNSLNYKCTGTNLEGSKQTSYLPFKIVVDPSPAIGMPSPMVRAIIGHSPPYLQ